MHGPLLTGLETLSTIPDTKYIPNVIKILVTLTKKTADVNGTAAHLLLCLLERGYLGRHLTKNFLLCLACVILFWVYGVFHPQLTYNICISGVGAKDEDSISLFPRCHGYWLELV